MPNKTAANEWVYTSKRGKVTHLLKAKAKTTMSANGQRETVCGYLVHPSNFREATDGSVKCMRCHDHVEPWLLPVVSSLEVAMLEKAKLQKIDDYVYCTSHTCVHANTLDPYDEWDAACLVAANGTGIGVKKEDVHRSLYVRWKVGDYPDVDA